MASMTTRLRGLPLLISCSLVAFLLGSVGTAVAGPALTEKAVKKIATKIVKKKAPKLSVKDSQRLAGRPASAYTEQAVVLGLQSGANAGTQSFAITLAPGRYVVTYNLYLLGAGFYSYCNIRRERAGVTTIQFADSSSEVSNPSLTGAGYLEVEPGDIVSLECASTNPWITPSTPVPQLIAQPLDDATPQPIVSSRASAAGRPGQTRR